MKKIIRVLFCFWLPCILASETLAATKDVTISASQEFRAGFINNKAPETLMFSIKYTHLNGKEKLEITHNGKTDSITELHYDKVERCLNALIYSQDTSKSSLTQESTLEIFQWIRNTIHGVSTRPPAGRFRMAAHTKYYDAIDDERMSHSAIDSIIGDLSFQQKKSEALKKELAEHHRLRDTIAKAYKARIDSTSRKLSNTLASRRQVLDRLDTLITLLNNKNYPDFDSLYKISNSDIVRENDNNILFELYIPELNKILEDINSTSSEKKNEVQKSINYLISQKVLCDSNEDVPPCNCLDLAPGKKQYDLNQSNDILKPQRLSCADSFITLIKTKKQEQYAILKDNLIQIRYAYLNGSISLENAKKQTVRIFERQSGILNSEFEEKIKQSLLKKKDIEKRIKSLSKQHIVKINRVDLQLERGFLENVKVIAEVNGVEEIFENVFAIGFTSKRNYKNLYGTKIFQRSNNSNFIYLGDVIRMYDNEIDLYTRDYSPADTFLKVNPAENPDITVYKADYTQLFDTKIFTDFTGISSAEPNGILQIELSRKLNLNTYRFQQYADRNWGAFTYLYVFGSLNKIERENKYLALRNNETVVNNTLVSPSYATTLDMLQYRNFMFGTELNTLLFDWPSAKSTFTLDFGAQYGHTPLVDSIRTITNQAVQRGNEVYRDAHMLLLYPKLSMELFPERRLGFHFSYQVYYTKIFTNNHFKQIMSYAKSNTDLLFIEPSSRWSHMFETNVRTEISKEGNNTLFLRARLFWQQGDVNTYFPQIQFGYSYFFNLPKI